MLEVFSSHVVSLLSCTRQTPNRAQGEGASGRDRRLGEWEGDAGHGAQGGEPLGTPGTPGLGGFTGRGAGAQVRSETHTQVSSELGAKHLCLPLR